MHTNDAQTKAACPLENATVDAERCAGCYRRSASSATCTGEDRLAQSDLTFLLLAL
ncbi:MAG TPA: hypothetical protein VI814_01350 [Candidatus Limnocylindria bacterium]